jgi:hypothetical protein
MPQDHPGQMGIDVIAILRVSRYQGERDDLRRSKGNYRKNELNCPDLEVAAKDDRRHPEGEADGEPAAESS